MKKFLLSLSLGVALILPAKSEAQSLGLQSNVLPGGTVALPGNTTNQYVPGNVSSTNSQGAGLNQIFIGTQDIDYLGLQLSSITGTNQTALSVPETITLTYAKSGNIFWPDSTGVSSITVTAKTATASTNLASVNQPDSTFTYIDVHGCAGIYVESLVSTNAANTATNYVMLQISPKAAKTEAIPATYRN